MSKIEQAMQNKHLAEHRQCLDGIQPMTAAERAAAPNIVMILMDDLGWGDLSCFGSQAIRTPHLDRLARDGIVMENCYASSPVCTPSRFGLLTGRYPCRGLIEHVFFPTIEPDRDQITPQGYENEADERDGQVTDAFVQRVHEMNRRRRTEMPVSGILEDELTIAELLRARGYRTGMFGKWHLGDRSPHLPNDKGFETFFGAHYSNDMYPYHFWRNREIAVKAPLDQRRITEYLNTELFAFIRGQAAEPFFAYYASPWPHHPLSSGESFAGTSRGGVYGDCIQEFDHGIGQLLDVLKEKDLLEKTLIVFTSDNGPWHQGSPGGHRGRKGNFFDGGQVVPTICFWQGTLSGRRIREMAMNIDFLPTFCELTGAKLPQDREIDGRSLLPLLLDQTDQSPHDVLFYVNSLVPVHARQGYAARSRDHFKYVQAAGSENAAYRGMRIHPFLFDLTCDRDESYDVRRLHPQKAEELRLRLDAFNDAVLANPRGWRPT
ncbi:MAG: sulfatase-like hydrolase/transferase [Clostridiaceae bacterium]|jgi:uncharacterized sulfatase|nr:sulfatase-like hydrolase/transferase [Clostridiaceae bacterium]